MTRPSVRALQLIEQMRDRRAGPRGFVEFNHRLYFSANNGATGYELWESDGSKVGTKQVLDLWPGSENGDPTEITLFRGSMFFFANNGSQGRELYRSDGTAAGTGAIPRRPRQFRPGRDPGQ